jgi:hypothetical protein
MKPTKIAIVAIPATDGESKKELIQNAKDVIAIQ